MDRLKKKAAKYILKIAAFIYSVLPELWKQKIKTKAAYFGGKYFKNIALDKMTDLELMERKLKQLSEEEAQAMGAEFSEDHQQTVGDDPGEEQAADLSEMMDSAQFTEIIKQIETMALRPVLNKYPKIGEKIDDDSLQVHAGMTAQYIKIKTGGKMDFETAYLSYTGFMAATILGVIAEEKIKERKAAKND